MSTWWQVYVNHTVFGFKTTDGIIRDHPDKIWKGVHLKHYKPWLIENNAQVWKIAEVQN